MISRARLVAASRSRLAADAREAALTTVSVTRTPTTRIDVATSTSTSMKPASDRLRVAITLRISAYDGVGLSPLDGSLVSRVTSRLPATRTQPADTAVDVEGQGSSTRRLELETRPD